MAWLRRNWKALVSLLVIPVVGNIFAGELRDLVYTWFDWKEKARYLWLTTAVSGVFLVGAVVFAVIFRREFLPVRDAAVGAKKSTARHPHVVLFLSNIRPDAEKFHDDCTPKWVALSHELGGDLALLLPHKPTKSWSWEMPLRGLLHHRDALASVTLVCSKESLPQAGWFAALLTGRYATAFPRLTPDAIRLVEPSGERLPVATPGAFPGWEFENYQQLHDGLANMLTRFAAEGVPATDVMLDVTGGQKTNSVVAAILTVNLKAKFQYVQTNPPHAVLAYDLVTDAAG